MVGWIRGGKFISAQTIIERRLSGAAETETPEQRLWLAVVLQAVADLFNKERASAEHFLFTESITPAARTVGLEPTYVRTTILDVMEAALSS